MARNTTVHALKKNMSLRSASVRAFGFALLCGSNHAWSQSCVENFLSEGNFLVGQTFSTSAAIPVGPAAAFDRLQSHTSSTGFSILSADRLSGVISATQTGSLANGRTTPLTITIAAEPSGTRIVMRYSTPAGAHSPEDAVRKHFCASIAAAISTANESQPSASNPPSVARQTALRGYALPTDEQSKAIQRELARPQQNERVKSLLGDAAPIIGAFVGRMACLSSGYEGLSALNEFAVPGTDLGLMSTARYPMRQMNYHDKAVCLTVIRIHGWNAPAANALLFEAVYKADDSGETHKLSHEIVRQSDGTWLVRH